MTNTTVTDNGIQTLTNKTLTDPKINLGSDATGDLYYRNASGEFERLPVGAEGEVVTSVSGVPAYAAAGGGGGMELITTTNITTSVSSVDFDNTIFTSGYDAFVIKGYVEVAGTTSLTMNVSSDNLSTFNTSRYRTRTIYGTSSQYDLGSTSTTDIRITTLSSGISPTYINGIYFEVKVNDIGSYFKSIFEATNLDGSINNIYSNGSGNSTGGGAWNSVRFKGQSANLNGGFISVYGITT